MAINTTSPNSFKLVITILAIIAVLAVGYVLMNQPDRRTTSEKIGDAVGELGNGVDKAAEQLESRTPAEKMGDAIEDAGDKIQKETH